VGKTRRRVQVWSLSCGTAKEVKWRRQHEGGSRSGIPRVIPRGISQDRRGNIVGSVVTNAEKEYYVPLYALYALRAW